MAFDLNIGYAEAMNFRGNNNLFTVKNQTDDKSSFRRSCFFKFPLVTGCPRHWLMLVSLSISRPIKKYALF